MVNNKNYIVNNKEIDDALESYFDNVSFPESTINKLSNLYNKASNMEQKKELTQEIFKRFTRLFCRENQNIDKNNFNEIFYKTCGLIKKKDYQIALSPQGNFEPYHQLIKNEIKLIEKEKEKDKEQITELAQKIQQEQNKLEKSKDSSVKQKTSGISDQYSKQNPKKFGNRFSQKFKYNANKYVKPEDKIQKMKSDLYKKMDNYKDKYGESSVEPDKIRTIKNIAKPKPSIRSFRTRDETKINRHEHKKHARKEAFDQRRLMDIVKNIDHGNRSR